MFLNRELIRPITGIHVVEYYAALEKNGVDQWGLI